MRLTMNFLRCVIIILARTGPREALTYTIKLFMDLIVKHKYRFLACV